MRVEKIKSSWQEQKEIKNMKGHPVFIGQHATATCCRGCLSKWHGISAGRELTEDEQAYVVDILMEWIRRQYGK